MSEPVIAASSSTPKSNKMTLIAGIIAALIILGLIGMVIYYARSNGSARTTAKITKLMRVCTTEEQGDKKANLKGNIIGSCVECGVELEYTVGTTKITNRVQLDVEKYKVGDTVDIMYLKDSPETFYVENAKS